MRQYALRLLESNSANEIIALLSDTLRPSLSPDARVHRITCTRAHAARRPELLQCYIPLAALVSSSETLATSSPRGGAQSVNLALISCRFGGVGRVESSHERDLIPRGVARGEQ